MVEPTKSGGTEQSVFHHPSLGARGGSRRDAAPLEGSASEREDRERDPFGTPYTVPIGRGLSFYIVGLK